jgi:hypothetical protein
VKPRPSKIKGGSSDLIENMIAEEEQKDVASLRKSEGEDYRKMLRDMRIPRIRES